MATKAISRRVGASIRIRATFAATVGALGLMASAGWFYRGYVQQTNNSIRLQDHALGLIADRRIGKRFPRTTSVRDQWGREVLYLQTSERFVLISFGRDGIPDSDYQRILDMPAPTPFTKNCYSLDMDTIVFDSGPTQACLK